MESSGQLSGNRPANDGAEKVIAPDKTLASRSQAASDKLKRTVDAEQSKRVKEKEEKEKQRAEADRVQLSVKAPKFEELLKKLQSGEIEDFHLERYMKLMKDPFYPAGKVTKAYFEAQSKIEQSRDNYYKLAESRSKVEELARALLSDVEKGGPSGDELQGHDLKNLA